MTLDQARAAVLATLADAGVTTVEVAGAFEPNGAGRLVVLVDDVSKTVDRLVGATRPTFAALTPLDEGSFSLHLVSGSWVAIHVATQEAWEVEPEEAPGEAVLPQALQSLDPEVWARIIEVADELTTSVPISDHRDALRLVEMVVDRVEQTTPEFVEHLRTLQGYIACRGAVSRLQSALKEQHITAMRRDAHAWAEKVYEADPVPARSRRAIFQEAAYRFMKRLDGQCATRMTTEAIASELEVVALEHAESRRH